MRKLMRKMDVIMVISKVVKVGLNLMRVIGFIYFVFEVFIWFVELIGVIVIVFEMKLICEFKRWCVLFIVIFIL